MGKIGLLFDITSCHTAYTGILSLEVWPGTNIIFLTLALYKYFTFVYHLVAHLLLLKRTVVLVTPDPISVD